MVEKNYFLIYGLGVVLTVVAIFYSYNLYQRGGYKKPFYFIPIVITLIIGVIIFAIAFNSYQDVILLLVPIILFISNRYIDKKRLKVKRIDFVAPKGLVYSNLLYSKINDTLDRFTPNYKITRREFGESEAITQNRAFLNSLETSPDLIILVANEIDENLFKNIKNSYRHNIPVILVDYPIGVEYFVKNKISPPAHISSDFEVGGRLAAKTMINLTGGVGNIIIISGPKTSKPSEMRRKAFMGEIVDHAPDLNIVFCDYVNDWSEEEAIKIYRKATRKLESMSIRFSGIFCCNDTLALGVLRETKNENVIVIGYDGIEDAMKSIKSGVMSATIDVQIDKQASYIIDEMKNALEKPLLHIRNALSRTLIEPKVVESNRQNRKISTYKAILFDMDGLMIENESAQLESFNKVLDKYNIHLLVSDWNEFVGNSQKNIFSEIKKKHGELKDVKIEDLMSQKKIEYFKIINNNLKATPGLYTLLEFIFKYPSVKIAIVSSSPRSDIIEIVHRLGIEKYFSHFISALDIEKPKPNKDCYTFATSELGVLANQCLVLEDSEVGVQAAIAAGMRCIAIPNEYTRFQNLSNATLTVKSLDDVKNYLNEVAE